MKRIDVVDCGECPISEFPYGIDTQFVCCTYAGISRVVRSPAEPREGIPEWCPLPDAPPDWVAVVVRIAIAIVVAGAAFWLGWTFGVAGGVR